MPKLVSLSLMLMLAMLLVACGGDDDAEAAVEPTPDPTPTPTLEDRRAEVLRELRSLMQIETATHSVETIVETEAEGGLFSRDRLMLVAHGQVRAGVDLTPMGDTNVEVIDERTIRVILPESVILEMTLDQDRTQVVSRETGLFSSEDEGLEVEALETAESRILESACDHEILERAATDAETRVRMLLTGLGYAEITVVGTPGSCP